MKASQVEVARVIRRVRGGSQAQLVEGTDGRSYVTKFVNNPQGTRILINEWLAAAFFQRLGISIPETRIMSLSDAVIDCSTDLTFKVGSTTVPIAPGLHLGSQCPVNPSSVAIFDWLPRKMLKSVTNREDFVKALVVDIWLGQRDSRQSVFVRGKPGRNGLAFHAYLIDNGAMFGGSEWEIRDTGRAPLYFNLAVYDDRLVDRIMAFAEQLPTMVSKEEMLYWLRACPSEWLSPNDAKPLGRLLTTICSRADSLPAIMSRYVATILTQISLCATQSEASYTRLGETLNNK